MTEELWQQLGHTEQLAYHAWPTYDEAKCVEQTIEIAVQVNGKVKAQLLPQFLGHVGRCV